MALLGPTDGPWLRFECNERIGRQAAQHRFTLAGQWTTLFGPSGSGKTTLLRLLAGLLPQGNGVCIVHGRELRGVPVHKRRVALADQATSIFPHLSVRQNVAFSRVSQYGPAVHDAVELTLSRFRLTHLAEARATEISGGESQRVVLARAVFAEPDVLLLDESFSGLDRESREQLRATLLETQRARAAQGRPMPIVCVTHDIGEVLSTANEVLRMQDGRIVAQGRPLEVLREERFALLHALDEH